MQHSSVDTTSEIGPINRRQAPGQAAFPKADSGPLLGSLTAVDPREVWLREDVNFTPWLLSNAKHLGDALGIELELTTAEHPVGAYSLDLIGEDKSHGVTLIVENQLEPSDHGHLGQLLTYAAGTDASSVVWITTQFRDEHRQALTWLNEHTDENTHFFGVELQVVQIGDSLPAPLFKIVAQPNDWGKAVKSATSGQAGVRSQLYLAFWTKFLEALNRQHRDWTRATPPSGNSCWMSSRYNGVGYVSVFAGGATIRQDVNIDRPTFAESHAIFDALYQRREIIEQRYGKALEWDAVDDRKLCRLSDSRPGDVSHSDEYDEYIAFFVDASERLRAAIGPELRAAVVAADEIVAAAVVTVE